MSDAPIIPKAGKKNPTAFLCHSGKDAETVVRLGTDLRGNGVDVWYSEWEIRPGESLRRKIFEEGIERAQFFFALLTPNSLASEWVHNELDAALVKKIEGTCRLVPILLGISDADVPLSLRSTLWIRIDDYQSGLRRLIDGCYDVTAKPPLGSPPDRVRAGALADQGVSANAERLVLLLSQRSENGLEMSDPELHARDILASIEDFTMSDLELAVDELLEFRWIETSPTLMDNIGQIWPSRLLFWFSDPALKGWNAEEDAVSIAKTMVNTNKAANGTFFFSRDLAAALQWPARRFNPAAYYLEMYDGALPSKALGSYPFARDGFMVTSKTRRWALR